MTSTEASQDITDAIAAGFDGFALNTHTISDTDTWNTDAITYLLNAASGTPFKMFLSFDMSWNLDVSGLGSFLTKFSNHSQYYTTSDGRPWVSTYSGGSSVSNDQWDTEFVQPLVAQGIKKPYFVPDFDDWTGYPTGFFDSFPVVDGAFSWESAWPGSGAANVSDSVDESLIEQAHAVGKVYMMRPSLSPLHPCCGQLADKTEKALSTFQFKYLGSDSDWYRIGETNLPERIAQILSLQPDFVEVITWNDAGESHYMGNFWPEQIAGTSEGSYADGYDHSGWQQVIKPFIAAYKNGATDVAQIESQSGSPEGAMWYRPLLTSASCASTITNYQQAKDAVNFAVILPAADTEYTIEVYSNNNLIGKFSGVEGLNYESVPGLQAGGGQSIRVLDGSGNVVKTANGTKDVSGESADASMCNWNYEVVGLS